MASFHWSPKPERKLCIFEMIYFARPDSIMTDETLYSYRLKLGRQLAKESLVDADIVIGVPDSGIPAAIGFSQESGILYAEGLIKNRYVGSHLYSTRLNPCENRHSHEAQPPERCLIGETCRDCR
jgi:amidophosphoribosyltransferase